MNCPTCGMLCEAPATFCGECGAQLAAQNRSAGRPIGVTVGSLTDVGRCRQEPNQDQILAVQHQKEGHGLGLFAVADGMGGHAAGDKASQIALEALYDFLAERLIAPWQEGALAAAVDLGALLRLAVAEAHQAVCRFNVQQQADSGTTLTAALLLDDQVLIAHVGDSRGYRLDAGELVPITADHSVVGDLVRSGQLEAAEIYTHPRRNEILQCLGQPGEAPAVELQQLTAAPGMQLLLCSDGLWEMVRDPAMARILLAHASPAEAVEALVAAANEAGGEDNISAVVLRFDGE
jgi:serine/threonine protein phosphatase PrpC